MENAVADKIKSFCSDRGISIEQLSERAGLTPEKLDLILNAEIIPSLSVLIKIARGLGVRLGTFLDDASGAGMVIHRNANLCNPATFSSQLSTANSHLDFYSLAGTKSDRHMEPFVIQINPSDRLDPILSSHEGEEFIYVLSGNVKVICGLETHILNQGDSAYYDSVVEHLVCAADDQMATILAVVYTPF